MQTNKKVSSMKNVNNTLNDKVKVPRNKRFKGNKKTKYSKNNSHKTNSSSKGPVVTNFKDIDKIFTKPVTPEPTVVEEVFKPFEEEYHDRLYDKRNYDTIDPIVLLNAELITDILLSPRAFITTGYWYEDKECIEKFLTTHSAVTLYKVFWTKELELASVFPDPKVTYNTSKNIVKLDISSQEVRNVFNETIDMKLKESELTKEQIQLFKDTLDDFIFNKAAAFVPEPKRNIFTTLKDFSIIGLF